MTEAIPSVFNQHKVSYNVLGGKEEPRKPSIPVTCVILSRASRHLRAKAFSNALERGFRQVISVNGAAERDSVDEFARRFPAIQFIVALEDIPQGELLNIAFSHATSPHVLVLQEELCVDRFVFGASTARALEERGVFCVAPRLLSPAYAKLPVVFAPRAKRSVFTVAKAAATSSQQRTLYAADWAGFYDTQKFILLGGVDYTITSNYWQKVDFFFRSWLWGEETVVASSFEAMYAGGVPEEDETVDISYLRFYLKNLAPVFYTDHARIPRLAYLPFKVRNRLGFAESARQFNDARRWVDENKYRFKTDAVKLIESWK